MHLFSNGDLVTVGVDILGYGWGLKKTRRPEYRRGNNQSETEWTWISAHNYIDEFGPAGPDNVIYLTGLYIRAHDPDATGAYHDFSTHEILFHGNLGIIRIVELDYSTDGRHKKNLDIKLLQKGKNDR